MSLPDYETGSHGNQGSKGRCSEREESRFIRYTVKKMLDVNFITQDCRLIHSHIFILSHFSFDFTVTWCY